MSDNEDTGVDANEYDVFREKYKGRTIIELTTLMNDVSNELDEAKAKASAINREYDFLRLVLLPERCDAEGCEGLKVEGVGRLSLTGDLYVSVKGGQQQRAQEWLRDIGKGDIIKETISSSSLKAVVRKMMQDGKEIPEGLLNVTPFTRASITRK